MTSYEGGMAHNALPDKLPLPGGIIKSATPNNPEKTLFLIDPLTHDKPAPTYDELLGLANSYFRTTRDDNYFVKSPEDLPEVKSPQDYYDRLQIFKSDLNAGIMPPLANGFSFVIDKRPDGNKEDYIPSKEYTGYFKNGQIPIAEPGHKLRSHDEFHGPNFQTLFALPRFARLVRNAATNAYDNPDACKVFTDAVDQFSDSMSSLERDDASFSEDGSTNNLYLVNFANTKLTALIDLEDPSAPPEAKEALLLELRISLDLPAYEQREKIRQSQDNYRRQARYRQPINRFPVSSILNQLSD